jgi:hypothetical protein
MRRIIAAVLLCFPFAPLVVHAQSAESEDTSPVFGVVEGYYRPDEAAELGAEWDRIVFEWYDFQPNNADEFITDSIEDTWLTDAVDANRQIVGLIKGTPSWASESGTPAGVPFGIELAFDDPDNVFGSFVERLVDHYARLGIHHWIVWNEPDIRPGEGIVEFEGGVEDYALLLRTAYNAVKAADPTAHVQMAGLTWWYDVNGYREPYLQRLIPALLAIGGSSLNDHYFDGISLHIYFTTSSVSDIILANERILDNFGLGYKEVWLNEFNASPRTDPEAAIDAAFQVSLEQQANFIVQAAALALALDVDRMAVYRLYDNDFTPGLSEPWGLVRGDGSLRPAYHAYQNVIQSFARATQITRSSNRDAEVITFFYPDHTLYALWNRGVETGDFLVDVDDRTNAIEVTDVLGEPIDAEIEDGRAVIPAPPAEMIDMNFVVVAGAVRLVEIPGAVRPVWYRPTDGEEIRLR